ncbi:MAG: hypothetical protein EOO38_23760 [Cytophagaceae bacterium]|nr:MAG: hypothetical protein EOO38_23760 [Cytophagaceae bacterium]
MEKEINIAYRELLDEIWTESKVQIVRAFLQRTVSPNMNLSQLLEVLRFSEVQSHLHSVKLGDVVVQVTRTIQKSKTQERLAQKRPSARKPRRQRRGAREVQRIKDALLTRVQASMGGTTAKHLVDILDKSGTPVDVLLVGRLLKELFSEGLLDCNPGKPNIWRGRIQGRRVPDPMIIRKAERAT